MGAIVAQKLERSLHYLDDKTFTTDYSSIRCTLPHALFFHGDANIVREPLPRGACVHSRLLECEINEERELIIPIRPRVASHMRTYIVYIYTRVTIQVQYRNDSTAGDISVPERKSLQVADYLE